MRPRPRRPTLQQLSRDPELVLLATLDLVIELAVASLYAQHQDIGHDVSEHKHPLTTAACDIIDAAHNLRRLLRRYRAVLARHYRNIPF